MKWPKIKVKSPHEFTRKQTVYTQYTLFVLLFVVNMQPASLRKNNVIVVVVLLFLLLLLLTQMPH